MMDVMSSGLVEGTQHSSGPQRCCSSLAGTYERGRTMEILAPVWAGTRSHLRRDPVAPPTPTQEVYHVNIDIQALRHPWSPSSGGSPTPRPHDLHSAPKSLFSKSSGCVTSPL
jgi:hypothetical protein